MTRRSKRKVTANKKKQTAAEAGSTAEDVQDISTQSDGESADVTKDESTISPDEQILIDDVEQESDATDEDKEDPGDAVHVDETSLEKEQAVSEEPEASITGEGEVSQLEKSAVDEVTEEIPKDLTETSQSSDQEASDGEALPEQSTDVKLPQQNDTDKTTDATEQNLEESKDVVEKTDEVSEANPDEEMSVDPADEALESKDDSSTVADEAAEEGNSEMEADDEPIIIAEDEKMDSIEECPADDRKNSVENEDEGKDLVEVEVESPRSKESDKSEKEAVVIELGTNDDLTDESPQAMKAADFQVLDEIDLTKSDDEEIAEAKAKELFEEKYVVPDYDDPYLTELEIDPELDGTGKVEETAEFLKYWHPVQDNPQEFTSWTYLLQFVEQNGNLPLARRAYNSFFSRYPLCYGYWKKFSELERKNGNILRAQKILERGVRAIPLSIDLWVHVTDFYIKYYDRPDSGSEKTRKVFERAIAASGQEFRSEKLWNKFVKWEIEQKNWMAIMNIYDKAIRTQTQHYSIIFSDFKSFVNKRTPRELLTEEEFQDYLSAVRKDLSAKLLKKASEKLDEAKDGDGDALENQNDDDLDEAPPGVDDEEKPVTDDDLKGIRARIISEKKQVYDQTEQAVTKIWAFEEGIKRPYFHVKQLERTQLKNWREYLDFEIGRDDHERVVLLFERCLIACALYEDFWLKYTKYMAKNDALATTKIFERACTIHLPKKPNIHMQWAAHEELQGNIEKSSKILENLDRVLPGMAMIRMRRVAVARRAGRLDAAEELLKSYVACAAKDKEEVFYTRKLSWFLLKIADKAEEAKKLMKDLIPKYKSELKIYNDLVEMEFQCAGDGYPSNIVEEGLAMEAFNLALSSEKLTEEQKFVFSQRKLEFLEDYGRDVKHLQKVYDEHQKLVRSQKKRTQIDLTTDETPSKKQKTDSTAISVVGSSQLANGASYTAVATAATSTTYATQQAVYASGDPGLYYQQQQQNYWNYASKPSDPQTQPPYNYSQAWSQYYGAQQHR